MLNRRCPARFHITSFKLPPPAIQGSQPLKFADLDLSDNLHAFTTLHGRRMIRSFGCLHGVKVPESLLDDPIADEPYIERFFRYAGSGSYRLLSERVCKSVTPG